MKSSTTYLSVKLFTVMMLLKMVQNGRSAEDEMLSSASTTSKPTRPSSTGIMMVNNIFAEEQNASSFNETALHTALFGRSRYVKHIRPIYNYSQPIKITLGMCFISINDIIEKDQTMETSGCLKMRWIDEFLQWSPEDYGNLSWLAVPSTEIWLPDIALTNSPDHYLITRKTASVEITYQGRVGYFPTGRFTTRCSIRISYFPFDWQTCDFYFASLTYRTSSVVVEPEQPTPIDLKDFQVSAQWQLHHFTAKAMNRTQFYGHDNNETFSVLRFRFYFQRRTLYYRIIYIVPCTLMSVLQCFSFTLAVEHSGRMNLLMSLFLATSVIQTVITSQMPKSSEAITLIQLYILIFSSSLIVSIVITMMHMNVWFRLPLIDEPSFSGLVWAFLFDTTAQLPEEPPPPPSSSSSSLLESSDEDEEECSNNNNNNNINNRKQLLSEPYYYYYYHHHHYHPHLFQAEPTPHGQRHHYYDEHHERTNSNNNNNNDEDDDDDDRKVKSAYHRRKDRWLTYIMTLDKFLLCTIGFFNVICPTVLFAIVPELQHFQMLMNDDDEII